MLAGPNAQPNVDVYYTCIPCTYAHRVTTRYNYFLILYMYKQVQYKYV